MTTPAADAAEHDLDDSPGVHIRCMTCNVEPMRAMCGLELDPDDELPASAPGASCPRCCEVREMHARVLHPLHRL